MSRLGIELLSVFGMPPVDYVHLAADLGCGHISTGLTQVSFNPHAYPAWSLRDDPALRRDMVTAARARGVSVSLGEGIGPRPNIEMRDAAADLDLFAELGTLRIGAVSMEPDPNRTRDQFALLAEMAAARGMDTAIEFAPGLSVRELAAAAALARDIGGRCGVTIDVMHFTRTHGTIDQLKAVDPALISYAQICDVPLKTPGDYMQEAMFGRLTLGEGETPWAEIVAALPVGVPLSLEIPQLAKAEAGIGPAERLKPSIDALKAALERLGA